MVVTYTCETRRSLKSAQKKKEKKKTGKNQQLSANWDLYRKQDSIDSSLADGQRGGKGDTVALIRMNPVGTSCE